MDQRETHELWEQCEKARAEALAEGKSRDEAHAAATKVWNEWAEPLLEQRKQLEEVGKWDVHKDEFGNFIGQNEETRTWLNAAKAVFSTKDDPHLFEKDVNCDGWVFPGRAWFERATFEGHAGFERVTFEGRAGFERVTFKGRAWFESATFKGRAWFTSATFKGYARFERATFKGRAWFTSATFKGGAGFERVTFEGGAWFERATFEGGAWFERVTFEGRAWFERATFERYARFESATFKGRAGFTSATFEGGAWFERAKFEGGAWFESATFKGYAWFERVTFEGGAGFERATFKGGAWFESATFKGYARFESATFKGRAWFNQASFAGYTTFYDATFEKELNFEAIRSERAFTLEKTVFKYAPNFIQANFTEAPRLDNSDFGSVPVQSRGFWSLIRSGKRKKDEEGSNLPAYYRALKRLAVQGHDRDRELKFNAREIMSRRGVRDFPFGEHAGRFWFGYFYQWFSYFGRSLLRPLCWWFGLIVVFAAFYLTPFSGRELPRKADFPQPFSYQPDISQWGSEVFSWAGRCEKVLNRYVSPNKPRQYITLRTNAIWEAIALSFRNGTVVLSLAEPSAEWRTLGCLYGGAQDSPFFRNMPRGAATAGAIQRLLSLVLIFLFGLALRNMLKLK